MKRVMMIAIVVVSAVLGAPAQAAISDPTIDVVGQWGTEKGCHSGAFNYVRDNGVLFQVIDDRGKTYRSELQVSIKGDVLSLIDEEKEFTYRIVGDDRIEFLGFTDLNTGLSARIPPRMWHRCSPT